MTSYEYETQPIKEVLTMLGNPRSEYKESSIRAVLWGKTVPLLLKVVLIMVGAINLEIGGNCKKSTFLDNFACFQNRTNLKSTQIET